MLDWIQSFFVEHSAVQAVTILMAIIALGLSLGRIKVGGVSLGVTFVFFVGIIAGHFSLRIDPQMLRFAEDFGLIIFVYALGLQVGPGFFNSFRSGGLRLNMLSVAVILLGTVMAVLMSLIPGVSLPEMVGILCGATTNTPALGAAQQTLSQMGLDASVPALGCAVTYPLGVVGVILAMIFLRKVIVKPSDIEKADREGGDSTFIATYVLVNPATVGKTVSQVASMTKDHFVISRIWRDGELLIPGAYTILCEGDRLLVTCSHSDADDMVLIFGKREDMDWNRSSIDWNALDKDIVSQRILVTRPSVNGHTIASMNFRSRFGVNVTRILRSGIMILAMPETIIRTGDKLVVVGPSEGIEKVSRALGNAVKELREPNLVSISIGIIIGLVIGAIPFFIPGMSAPLKVGLAGGQIIAGILVGAFGPRIHMVAYTTESANLMLRRLGLSLYLACLGLESGARFFETVFRPEGALWIGLGFLITVIPVLIVGAFSVKAMKVGFGTVCGMLCGSMANPMALTYATDNIPGNSSALSYTQVYPLGMFLRVIIAQTVLALFL
ncbi:MAG: putative transporter [Bacteroidales bacterium]|nr:putative transporter [Bacteroidales bacterium]